MKFKKSILYILLLFICSCKQTGSEDLVSNDKFKQSKKISSDENQTTLDIDTIFLLNEKISDNYFYKVYESREPSLYKSLAPEEISEIYYVLGNQDIMNTQLIKSINYKELPKKWNEVIYYNDKFYLNYPSDFCVHKRAQFKDGAFIDFTCEGPWAYNIAKINRGIETRYEITLSGNKSTKPDIIISIVNKDLGIYQWESSNYKMLVTNSENYHKLLIAKAYCGGNKCPDTIKSQEF